MDIISSILSVMAMANLLLGFFVSKSNRKRKADIFYTLLAISVAVWSVSIYFFREANFSNLVSMWGSVVYISAAATAFFFLYFSLFFANGEKIKTIFHIILIGVFGGLSCLILTTDLIIEGVVVGEINGLLFGGVHFLYGFYFLVFFGIGILNLIFRHSGASKEIKAQIKYILAGSILSVSLGIFTNIILFTRGLFQYNWLGPTSTIFMVVCMAYAITKHHLFDVRVIATELLVGLVSIVLLIDLLLAEGVSEILLKLGILIVFVFMGWSLIRSVLKEIERRQNVERLSGQLKRAYAQLKKLDTAKSEFISIASHQLRTPLTIIKGYISMAREGFYGEMPEKVRGPLKNVFDSNERLINLVNELLTLSKIESGKLEMNFEKANLEDLILGLIDEFKLKVKEKKIYLRWQKPKKPLPKIFIDVGKMRQVFLNILDNGIRYTAKGGLEISSKVNGKKIRIIIKDTGAGMAKNEISKLFSSFSRGATGRKVSSEGAGLGLYVAKKYVKMNKGRVWVESEGKGKGSTFFVELPINKGSD